MSHAMWSWKTKVAAPRTQSNKLLQNRYKLNVTMVVLRFCLYGSRDGGIKTDSSSRLTFVSSFMETNWSVGAEPFPQIVTDFGGWGTLSPGVVWRRCGLRHIWNVPHTSSTSSILLFCSFSDNRMMHVARRHQFNRTRTPIVRSIWSVTWKIVAVIVVDRFQFHSFCPIFGEKIGGSAISSAFAYLHPFRRLFIHLFSS